MVWTSDYPEGRPRSDGRGAACGSRTEGDSSNAAKGAPASAGSAGSSGNSGGSDSSGGLGGLGGSGKTGATGMPSSSSSKSAACAVAQAKASSSRYGSGKGSKSTTDPHTRTSPNPISGSKQKNKGTEKPPKKPGIFLLLGGVVLPAAAIAVELTTHMCAKSFFDPLPTPSHVLLCALIPLSNFMVWMAARRNMTDMLGMLTLGTGMAMGVAILYSLMFLPLVPLSIVAILWFGFGLLALSPLLAIPALWKSGKYAIHLSRHHKTYFDGHQLEHIGHMIILCTVVAVELPSTLTRMHIGEAAHSKEPVKAIEWLRSFGSQEVMLRACYERSGRATDILGSLYEVKNPTSVSEAREIFYRVTGKPFNSVPLPASLRATRQNQGLLSDGESEEPNVEDEFDQDPDIAGETVSGVARGLTMNESKLAGFVDSNSCIADLMWNVTFGNTSKYDREVRSKILLPPGAVITNAFLIVDGTEREATVMGRSMARRRYRAAVADKKDPLLVSTCGADRVLLQLYPVAPESKIGVRLNIIAPLAVSEMNKVDLALPTFEERNFQVDIPTTINLKADKTLSSTARELKASGRQLNCSIDGSLTTPELARFGAVVSVERDPKITQVIGSQYATYVGETIRKKTYPKPNQLTVVIDGSNGMSPHFESVLKELGQLPADMRLKLVYVRDGLMTSDTNTGDELMSATSRHAGPVTGTDMDARSKSNDTNLFAETPAASDALLKRIGQIPCAGGQINLPSVSSEIATAMNNPDAAVLWLHAAQPIPGKLDKRLELNFRRLKKPLLYDFAVAAGPNEVLSGLYACPGLVRVDRGGDVQSDLHRLFETWRRSTANASTGGIEFFRKKANNEHIRMADTALARLVAFDEISKIQTVHSGHRCSYARKAVQLSNQYHLVTAFSSAIITDPIPPKRSSVSLSMLGPNDSKPGFQLKWPERPMSLSTSRMVDVSKFAPMMAMQENKSEALRAKKMAELDSNSRYSSDAQANMGSYNAVRQSQFPKLEGATNGSVGPQSSDALGRTGSMANPFASAGSSQGGLFASAAPSQGDHFSSAGSSQGDQFASSATESFAPPAGSSAPVATPAPVAMSPSMQVGGGGGNLQGKDVNFLEESGAKSVLKMKSADEPAIADFREAPSRSRSERRDFAAAKEQSSEYKQNALKNDRDNVDEFSDDIASDDGADDTAPQSSFSDKSGEVASPVVPESDTYLLFAVGMLGLGFALRNKRKARVKKA